MGNLGSFSRSPPIADVLARISQQMGRDALHISDAAERYGVQALGEELARAFGLGHQFVDTGNPV